MIEGTLPIGGVSSSAKVIIYEPTVKDGQTLFGSFVVNDVERFKRSCDSIFAKRYETILDDVEKSMYMRVV